MTEFFYILLLFVAAFLVLTLMACWQALQPDYENHEAQSDENEESTRPVNPPEFDEDDFENSQFEGLLYDVLAKLEEEDRHDAFLRNALRWEWQLDKPDETNE